MFTIQWAMFRSKTVIVGLATAVINYLVAQGVINEQLGELLFNAGAFLTLFFLRLSVSKNGPEVAKLTPPRPGSPGTALIAVIGTLLLFICLSFMTGCGATVQRIKPHTHGAETICTNASGSRESNVIGGLAGSDARVRVKVYRPEAECKGGLCPLP